MVKTKHIQQLWHGALTFAKRDLKTRYAGSILGISWIVIYPLSMALITSFVFAFAFKGNVDNIPFFLYTLTGFSVWIFFSQTVAASCRALIQNRDIIVNNKIPTEIILGGVVLSRIIDLFVITIFFSLVAIKLGFFVFNIFLFVESFFVLIAFTFALAMLVSAANVYFRDVQALTDIFLNLLFYATPIIYPIAIVPTDLLYIFNFNPLTSVVMSYRKSFLISNFEIYYLHWVFVTTFLIFPLAYLTYKSLERKFAQYL